MKNEINLFYKEVLIDILDMEKEWVDVVGYKCFFEKYIRIEFMDFVDFLLEIKILVVVVFVFVIVGVIIISLVLILVLLILSRDERKRKLIDEVYNKYMVKIFDEI